MTSNSASLAAVGRTCLPTRLACVTACLLAGALPLRAEWGTLAEMHHYRECFGLDAKAKPDFAVTMLSSTAPGNVFHEGEQPQFTFQIENLSDQPLQATGRVDVLRYAQPAFPGDQWNPDLVRLETLAPVPLAVDLGPQQWTNLTISPPTPETKGGYGLVVDLETHGRAYLTSYVRTFRPSLERIQFPKQSLEEMPAPILERLGVQAIRWGVSYFQSGTPEYERQWERIARELREFHEHKVTVVAEVGAGSRDQPLGRGRPHLDEQGWMQEGTKEDLVWLPALDDDYQAFCYRLVTEFGWPRGPVTAIKLWNEPWEGLSISGWGADMVRYRELFRRMGQAVFEARRQAGVDVLVGGCDSSANTIDKLFGDNWDEWLPYLDFCSIHYQGLSAPVLYPPWNQRTHYKGRVLIWDTESWVANTDDRFAGVVAANRAAGYDRSMGTLSRIAISTLSHNRVATDMVQTAEGRRRVERHIEARPLAAAYGAVQHLIGEREFREIVFTNGLPWVFAFHGLDGNPDDGTVVIVGDLATLFEKGTPLFSGVRSLDEVRAKEPLEREFRELPPGDAKRTAVLRQWNEPQPLRHARLVIPAADQPFRLFDAYGNMVAAPTGPSSSRTSGETVGEPSEIAVPLDETGHFLRADPQAQGSFERLLAAIRTARVEGLEPLEIIAYDFTSPIAGGAQLRLRLTSQHSQPLHGRLSVSVGGAGIPDYMTALDFAPREQKWIELPVSGSPRPDNTYPLSVRFDAGDQGAATHVELLHVNWIAKRTVHVDGSLADWGDTLPQILQTDAATEQSFEEKMYLPFEKAAPSESGGLAIGYVAADDEYFYFAAKIADDNSHPGSPRFETWDEDADFYPEVSQTEQDGRTIDYRWPAGVRRFSYRRWPMIPSGMPQQPLDNVLLAFNALPPAEKDWQTHVPGRFPKFIWYKTTDYEYALNHVAAAYGGGTEIWRLLAPGMPFKHFFPRQPKHALEGAVRDGRLAVRYEGGWRIVECAIPWAEIPHVQTLRDAGQTVKFNFRVNHSTRGADLMLSMQRSAAEGLSHSFHPNWIRQWPNELEFGFER